MRKYFKPGDTVLDPFSGSGTTLVQANELGINSIGADISEFNILVSKVKTQKYNIEKVKFELKDIINKTGQITGNSSNELKLFHDPNIDIYFWVDWQCIKFESGGKYIEVEPIADIYKISFSELNQLCEKAPIHYYAQRRNDIKGNAKGSFVLEVNNNIFEKII